jgi:hypothetical protein
VVTLGISIWALSYRILRHETRRFIGDTAPLQGYSVVANCSEAILVLCQLSRQSHFRTSTWGFRHIWTGERRLLTTLDCSGPCVFSRYRKTDAKVIPDYSSCFSEASRYYYGRVVLLRWSSQRTNDHHRKLSRKLEWTEVTELIPSWRFSSGQMSCAIKLNIFYGPESPFAHQENMELSRGKRTFVSKDDFT